MIIEMYRSVFYYVPANMLTDTVPTPAGMGTLSHTLTPELFVDLSATLFPVVRLLD